MDNRLKGGEWRNVVQVGDNDVAGTEYYQPLDARLAWFFEARAGYRRDEVRLQVGDALTEYRFGTRDAYAGFGRVFSSWGSIAAGAFRSHEDGRPKIRLRPHDYDLGWFSIIAARHGKHSVECRQAREIVERAGQLYFPEIEKA